MTLRGALTPPAQDHPSTGISTVPAVLAACLTPKHERFKQIWSVMAADGDATEGMRRQLGQALKRAIPVQQRIPLGYGTLRENGKPQRYYRDGESIDGEEPESD
jgi:hypothetical protein